MADSVRRSLRTEVIFEVVRHVGILLGKSDSAFSRVGEDFGPGKSCWWRNLQSLLFQEPKSLSRVIELKLLRNDVVFGEYLGLNVTPSWILSESLEATPE